MSVQEKNQPSPANSGEAPRPLVAVMSSGFFGFFAHAGFLQGLNDLGLEPDAYAGSSSGALVAAYAAGGMPPLEMLEAFSFLRKNDFWDPPRGMALIKAALTRFKGRSGYLAGEAMEQLLRDSLPEKRFEDCPKPCLIVSLDIEHNQRVVHTQGSLAPAIRASGAVPIMFAATPWKGRLLVDGGLVDKAPMEASRRHLDARALAVHLLPSSSLAKPASSILKRSFAPLHLQRRAIDAARKIAYEEQRELVKSKGVWLQEVRQDELPRLSPKTLNQGPKAFALAREATKQIGEGWFK